MKRILRRAVSRIVPRSDAPGLRVLLYHAVDEPHPADRLSLRVSPAAFRSQMELLKTEGYQVVPLKSLLSKGSIDTGRQVAVTFDDGYQSQRYAAATLEEFGFPATFFVVMRLLTGDQTGSGYWEKWSHMTWADIRLLADRGFEIGAHSVTHPRLTQSLPGRRHQEVQGAKSCLEDRLGRPIVSFSYPYGAYNEVVQQIVKEAGYQLACTSIYGTNRAPWPWFELRRIEISGADRLVDFRHKLQGKYDWLGHWQRWSRRYA